jgi:predicted GNAT family N-acyltransferase
MEENVDIKIVTTDTEYAQAMDLRRQVFVCEQHIPEELEFDGNDHSSTHVMALSAGKPVGVMRIRYFNGFVKFERMCVLPAYRKTDVSEQIMRKAMKFSAQKGYDKVYGVCKKELLHRWQRDGFDTIAGVEPTIQNGMTLLPIIGPLPKTDEMISINTDPMILNKQEGEWFSGCQNEDNERRLLKLEAMRKRALDIKSEDVAKMPVINNQNRPYTLDSGKEY